MEFFKHKQQNNPEPQNDPDAEKQEGTEVEAHEQQEDQEIEDKKPERIVEELVAKYEQQANILSSADQTELYEEFAAELTAQGVDVERVANQISEEFEQVAYVSTGRGKQSKKNSSRDRKKESAEEKSDQLDEDAVGALNEWNTDRRVRPGEKRYEALMQAVSRSAGLKNISSKLYSMDVKRHGVGYTVKLAMRHPLHGEVEAQLEDTPVALSYAGLVDNKAAIIRTDLMSSSYPPFKVDVAAPREVKIFDAARKKGYRILSQNPGGGRRNAVAVIQKPDGTNATLREPYSGTRFYLHRTIADYLEAELNKEEN